MRFYRSVYLILLFTFLIAGCRSDDDTLVPDTTNEPTDAINIGDYQLLNESIESLPYLDKTKILFIDSFNNEVYFDIQEFDLFQSDSSYLFKYNVFEEGDTVKYLYSGEIKWIRITNDSLDMEFHVTLKAHPYYPDPEQGYIADILDVSCRNPDSEFTFSQIFYDIVDIRTWPDGDYYTEIFTALEFIGRTFQNVHWNGFSDPKSQVYFNYEFGIVSFTDFDGNLWRFEDIE